MVDVKRVDVSNFQKDNFFQTSILKLKINYDAGTQSGKRFRLRGKGMPGLRGTSRGDAYVETLVETPVNLTKRQKELLKEFSADGNSRGPQTDSFSEKLKRFWSGNL